MAQGTVKQKKAAPAKKSNVLHTRKGSRAIAPKNKKLIDQQKLVKKITAGITAKTERALAERAGHLELLAGGKKSKASAGSQQQKNKKGGK